MIDKMAKTTQTGGIKNHKVVSAAEWEFAEVCWIQNIGQHLIVSLHSSQ